MHPLTTCVCVPDDQRIVLPVVAPAQYVPLKSWPCPPLSAYHAPVGSPRLLAAPKPCQTVLKAPPFVTSTTVHGGFMPGHAVTTRRASMRRLCPTVPAMAPSQTGVCQPMFCTCAW